MTSVVLMTSSEGGYGGEMDDAHRWLERLPVGSRVSIEALREFKWPIDPIDSSRWLRVGCVQSFGQEEILEWMRALPREGVIVDQADPRLEKLASQDVATAGHVG